MSVYKDMAHDAGYRGEEAEQMAQAIEQDHMRQCAEHQEQIPDPIELMQRRIDRNCDRVTEVDGILMAPCGNCDKRVPLDDLTCMSPTGDDPGLCPDCFEEWGKR